MAIDLSEYEAAPRHDGDYGERLATVQKRLAQAQTAHVVHRRSAMIVFEGWDGAGKGGAIQRLTAAWDPRAFSVFAVEPPTPQERARHHLARFWETVPAAGRLHVLDRSWYGRVLGDRVAGLVAKPEWRRAYDEINEFEAQQKDSGTTVVKLFLHVGAETQDAHLRERLAHPWKRHLVTPEMLRARESREAYRAALDEMFAYTDTRWAPWKAIDAGHPKYARLAALEHVATVLEKAVPTAAPAADEALMAMAREMGLLEHA